MLDIFSQADWSRVLDDWEGWWNRTREKPILNLTFEGADPHMKRPEGRITGNLYECLDEPAEMVVEKLEYQMRCRKYEFQAYPSVNLYYGPDPCCEYLGFHAIATAGTVWFTPKEKIPAAQRKIRRDPDSLFLPSMRAICKAADDRFRGGYAVTTPELFSVGRGTAQPVDYLAEFYDPMELSYLLYDDPAEVHRLLDEIVATLDAIDLETASMNLHPHAQGYTYDTILAPIPWLGIQCDFSSMIGPDFFEEFVAPYIEESLRRSPRYNMYHLDGPGELTHFERILSMQNLRCIQWVPGPQKQADTALALDLYHRMYQANVNSWVLGPLELVREAAEKNGTAKGLYWMGSYPISEYDRVMRMAEDLMNGH